MGPAAKVQLLEPTSRDPYFRAIYRDEFGRRRSTHVGREREGAMLKVEQLERRLLSLDPASRSAATVGNLIDAYLDPERDKFPGTPRRSAWTDGYTAQLHVRLNPQVRKKLDGVALGALSRVHIASLLDSCVSNNEADQLRRVLRAIVNFGVRRNMLRPDQGFVTDVDLPTRAPVRPPRQIVTRWQGEDVQLVDDTQVPTVKAVAALGAADVGYCHWQGMVETLAYTGPRIHECIALSAPDVIATPDGRTVLRVDEQLVELWRGGTRCTPPKNGRARLVAVPERTPDGFALAAWLRHRAEQALQEQANGLNSLALLFPTKRKGTHWRLRNLRRSLFVPAAEAAGWESVPWRGCIPYRAKSGRVKTRAVTGRLWVHTIHSLRHRFATTARDDWQWNEAELCQNGGWASEAFVMSHYYGRTKQTLASSFAKQAAHLAPKPAGNSVRSADAAPA